MSSDSDFVHIHVHTEFSLLDGLSRIDRLVERAVELNMPALAISDHGTMYGVIDFYRACRAAGVKPIIGMETYLAPWGRRHTERDPQLDSKPYHMLLLARNQTGYQNLLKIASEGQLNGYYYRPRVDHDFLEQHAAGLIATSGCLAAEIPRLVALGQDDVAQQRIGWYQDVFGAENFFLELQSHQIPELDLLNRWLLAHQSFAQVPLVATNDVHYVLEDDFDAHDTLLCVQTGSVKAERNRLRFSGPTFHLRAPHEMWQLFDHVPEALHNTLRIAEMCELDLEPRGYHLPVFPVPEGFEAASYLRHLCEQGLRWRYGEHADDPRVRGRLEYELDIIHDMGFDTYFLIVWDLCEFARHADIWWNVRGSGAGSVAAYSLGITNIDPLQNSLLFERFLNPGRVSMPDIDLDYPEDRRAEMIEYCAQKYGEDKVAAIITFGTMGSKAAIRDVGRALDMPLTEVDRIARLIPSGAKPVKFKDALGDDPERALPELKQVYQEDANARRLIDAARALEGVTRHASTHAAGVIVADKPLVEYIPLHRPTKGSAEDAPVKMVTQFPMETCESIGLLKVDFLGLSTLTIMRLACDLIAQYHGIRYDMSNIPYRPDPDDPEQSRMMAEMFEMLGRGETIGVFQLESQGMRRMLTDMRPQRFEHIVAGISLYRPGPMEYIGTYNRRLHGDEQPNYKHPALAPILEETFGIIVYQEQIMQIGAELFGYSLGEADLMRRAVSKKKREALQEHRTIFMERGPEYGVDKEAASAIFDDIEFFARYGFNKSHAADYAVLTCQTAFLKCHYPHEYMAALMSVHRDDSSKVGLFAADCHRMGIDVLPPTVNNSELDFSIEARPDGTRAIRFGLGAIKNVGVGPLQHILEARADGGPFQDLDDFCHRVDARLVNKRPLESLIKVGALDEFASRAGLLAALDRIVSFSADHHKAKDSGQMSLFGEATGVAFGAQESILANLHDVDHIGKREMLSWEKELVGLYVTDHPLRPLTEQLSNGRFNTTAELIELGEAVNGRPVTVAGLVTGLRQVITKRGDTMAVLTLEDITGTISVVLFPRTWNEYRDLVDEDAVLIVRGKADTARGDVQVIADAVTQNFELVTPVEQLPNPADLQLSWVDDDEAEAGDESEDEPEDDLSADSPIQEAPPAVVTGNGRAAAPSTAVDDERSDEGPPPWLDEGGDWAPMPDWDAPPARPTPPPPADPPPSPQTPLEVPSAPLLPTRRRASQQQDVPRPRAPERSRLLTVYIPRGGDPARDRQRIHRLHGFLTQYPGRDRFRFILVGADGARTCLNFPKHPIEINEEMLAHVRKQVGDESFEIEE